MTKSMRVALSAVAAIAAVMLAVPAQAVPVETHVKLGGAKKKSVACVNEVSETCKIAKKGVGGGAEGGCLKLLSNGEIYSKPVKVDVLISHHNLPAKLAQVGCTVDQPCPDSKFPFDPAYIEDGAWARFYLADFEEHVFLKRDVSGNPSLWASDESDGCLDNANVGGVCEFIGKCRAGLVWDKVADFVADADLKFDVVAADGDVSKDGPQIIIQDVSLIAESRQDVYVWLSKNNAKAGKFGCNEYGTDPVGCAATVGFELNLIKPTANLYTGPGVAKKIGDGGVAVTGNPGIFIYYEGELIFQTRFSELKNLTN